MPPFYSWTAARCLWIRSLCMRPVRTAHPDAVVGAPHAAQRPACGRAIAGGVWAFKDAGKWLFRLQFPTPIFSVLACPTANTSCPQPVHPSDCPPTVGPRARADGSAENFSPATFAQSTMIGSSLLSGRRTCASLQKLRGKIFQGSRRRAGRVSAQRAHIREFKAE